jgi:hypothetical protein
VIVLGRLWVFVLPPMLYYIWSESIALESMFTNTLEQRWFAATPGTTKYLEL